MPKKFRRWVYLTAEPAALEALTHNYIAWHAGTFWQWWPLQRITGVAVYWPQGLVAQRIGAAIVTRLPDGQYVAHNADNVLTLDPQEGRTIHIIPPESSE